MLVNLIYGFSPALRLLIPGLERKRNKTGEDGKKNRLRWLERALC